MLGSFGSDDAAPPTWEVVEDHLAGTASVRPTRPQRDGCRTAARRSSCRRRSHDRIRPPAGQRPLREHLRVSARRDGLDVFVVADGTTLAGPVAFDMTVGLRVEVDGERFFERRWDERITRDLL